MLFYAQQRGNCIDLSRNDSKIFLLCQIESICFVRKETKCNSRKQHVFTHTVFKRSKILLEQRTHLKLLSSGLIPIVTLWFEKVRLIRRARRRSSAKPASPIITLLFPVPTLSNFNTMAMWNIIPHTWHVRQKSTSTHEIQHILSYPCDLKERKTTY